MFPPRTSDVCNNMQNTFHTDANKQQQLWNSVSTLSIKTRTHARTYTNAKPCVSCLWKVPQCRVFVSSQSGNSALCDVINQCWFLTVPSPRLMTSPLRTGVGAALLQGCPTGVQSDKQRCERKKKKKKQTKYGTFKKYALLKNNWFRCYIAGSQFV